MRVLGIETSTDTGGIAIVEDGILRGEWSLNLPRSHSLRLLPALKALLEALGLEPRALEGIAVGTGPGSFTGLRIGLSVAKGLAMALERPLVGVPSLDALALGIPSRGLPIYALIDAKRGELFGALYRGGRRQGPFEVLSPASVIERIRGGRFLLLGEGALLYKEKFEGLEGVEIAPLPSHHPRASAVAFLGWERLKDGHGDDLDSLTPLYIRPPDAELKGPRP